MKESPKITVLMSVYNGERYVRAAIDSVLNQTFTDFEFLIMNDGSTDGSKAIMESYTDPRIRIIHQENIGLTRSLNNGLDMARGEYIARMDADDVSFPERFERQVAFMDTHPEIGVCGTSVKIFGDVEEAIWLYPADPEEVRSSLIFNNSLAHPSVMMRRRLFGVKGLRYNDGYTRSQDYELWSRTSKTSKLSNIPVVLLMYRMHSKKVGVLGGDEQLASADQVRRSLIEELGIAPSSEELFLHSLLSMWQFKPEKEFIKNSNEWLVKLMTANAVRKVYPETIFCRLLADKWYRLCVSSLSLGWWTWKSFRASPLSVYVSLNWGQKKDFILSCLRASLPE